MKKGIIFSLLAILLFVSNRVNSQITWTMPDSTVMQNDTILYPILTSDVSGEGVLSFEMNMYLYQNAMTFMGIETTGTLTDGWLIETHQESAGTRLDISVSGASATEMSGEGVVFYLRLICHNSQNIYFNNANEVNESVPVTTDDGLIYVTPPPILTLSPNQASLFVGQTQTFTLYGNSTGPITYSVSDTNVATIDSLGNLTGLNPGIIYVTATDSLGYSDDSDQIAINGFQVTAPDTTYTSLDTVILPIRLTRYSPLDIYSGEFSVTFPEYRFRYLGYDIGQTALDGAMLSMVDDEGSYNRKLTFVFANATPIIGDDLLYLTFVHENLGYAVNSNVQVGDALLNETYSSPDYLASIYIEGITSVTIAPSNNRTLFVGEGIQFSTNAGEPPYTYTVVPTGIGEVDSAGYFQATAGGTCRVRVTDVNGEFAESGLLTVFDGTVQIDSRCGGIGDTVILPIYLSTLPNQDAVYSFDFELSFDDYYVEYLDFVKQGTASQDWFVLDNELPNGNIRLIAAGASATTGDDILVYVRCALKNTANSNGTYSISLVNSVLNEGAPNVEFINGAINESQSAIFAIEALTQTACNSNDNTFTQELLIHHAEPATGDIIINGTSFSISSSPQIVTLSGMNSDGQEVDVTAYIAGSNTCSAIFRNVFIAPDSCFIPILSEIYVDSSATGANNGSSWADAYTHLPDGINRALTTPTKEIWVAKGTYYPTNTIDRTATFMMHDSLEIYGGFAGVETSKGQRNPTINRTVLSGNIGASATSTDNVFHVVHVPATVSYGKIDGVEICEGRANGASLFNTMGAGVTIEGVIAFTDVTFRDNSSTADGASILVSGSSAQAILTNVNAFKNNQVASPSNFYVMLQGQLDALGGCYLE